MRSSCRASRPAARRTILSAALQPVAGSFSVQSFLGRSGSRPALPSPRPAPPESPLCWSFALPHSGLTQTPSCVTCRTFVWPKERLDLGQDGTEMRGRAAYEVA